MTASSNIGLGQAYFRVHYFARQLASPFPLLAAVGVKISRIEIGTAVIDMRYEHARTGHSRCLERPLRANSSRRHTVPQ